MVILRVDWAVGNIGVILTFFLLLLYVSATALWAIIEAEWSRVDPIYYR